VSFKSLLVAQQTAALLLLWTLRRAFATQRVLTLSGGYRAMATARVPDQARPRVLNPGRPTSRRGASPSMTIPRDRPPTAFRGWRRSGHGVVCASAPRGSLADMQVTLVSVKVTPGDEEDFASESIANAMASIEEPENCRFDVLRAIDHPSRFVLVEIYETPDGVARHKETSHYAQWRENVQDMMASTRSARKYAPIYPWPGLWGTSAASRRARDDGTDPVADGASRSGSDETETAAQTDLKTKASTFLSLDADGTDADSLALAHEDADRIDGFDVDRASDSRGDAKVIAHVRCRVKPEFQSEFAEESIANAASSVLEPGNLRFDVLRDSEDGAVFLLIEVYDSAESAAAHKRTPHYAVWRKRVEEMMAEPRKATTYVAQFPQDEAAWKMKLSDE